MIHLSICSSFRQILPQMSALSWSQSIFILHPQISRFRPRFRSMINLPRSISALSSIPRSNSGRSKGFYTHSLTGSSSLSPIAGSVIRKSEVFRTNCTLKPSQWLLRGTATVLFISFASAQSTSADATIPGDNDSDDDGSTDSFSHGKKVFMDYTITGIPGDGRCLFRSMAHGACLRSGKAAPDEALQRKLADELRSRVADEFVKRREETEWFIEGDFDSYVLHIRKPHVWGGEPEILMATHVLGMPITVYIHEENASGVIAIAEYGQEYGKENPIRVLYHGYGHYEALQIPSFGGQKSRL